MTMRRIVLVLLASCALLAAEEPRRPLLFFRTPDPETKKEIEDLLTSYGLGQATRVERTRARNKLREIGRWAVPPLVRTIGVRKRLRGTIPMNAVMTLARIEDPHCLDALREAASKHPDKEVSKAACRALGIFREGRPETAKVLQELLSDRDFHKEYQRTAALALGKIPDPGGVAALVAATKGLPSQRFVAAATLLAACIRTADVAPERFLAHREELVRKAAAACACIRPLDRQRSTDLLEILRRPTKSKDPELRALLYHALAAMDRTDEIRERLLKCAIQTRENKEARIAALIGLSYEAGNLDIYKPLKKALPKGRNDPVAAAMLFALARTGEPRAVKDLIQIMEGGASRMRFYAAGCLLYLVTVASRVEAHPRELEIFQAIGETREQSLEPIRMAAGALKFESDLQKRHDLARETWFKDIRDPYVLHLWDWTHVDRAWALVNELLPEILELDDIADKRAAIEMPDNGAGEKDGGEGGQGPGGGKRASGTPAEQDMLDFLSERPYYGPEDLGAR